MIGVQRKLLFASNVVRKIKALVKERLLGWVLLFYYKFIFIFLKQSVNQEI